MNSDRDLANQLKEMEEAIDAARVLNSRENFVDFCEYVMLDDKGAPWVMSQHQREWSERFDGAEELLLTVASRGSAKTTTLQARCLWELGRNPNTCIKYVCGSDDLSIDRLRFIRTNILGNERYQKVFPHIKPSKIESEWTKHKIFIDRPSGSGLQDASVECSSVTASGTGGRSHILVLDDIIDATIAIVRPGVLATIKSMVENDWMNTLFPGGRAWMIGTFWSFDPPDIYVEYSGRPEWNPWIRPACQSDEHGNLVGPWLWPERWDKATLDQRRKNVGEESFQQQYLLKGTIQRSQFFSAEHIAAATTTSCSLGESPFDLVKVGMGVDVATSLKKKTGSYSCVFVTGVGHDGRKIPLAIARVKADPEVVATAVIELYQQWLPSNILVENNATQQALISLIRVIGQKYGIESLPMKGRFTGVQKWHPDAGLPGLNAEMAQNKWVIPKGGDHYQPNHQCSVCHWVNELKYWGKPRMPNGRKPTTDIIMAWWLSNGAVEGAGSFGELPAAGIRERKEVVYGTHRVAAAT